MIFAVAQLKTCKEKKLPATNAITSPDTNAFTPDREVVKFAKAF